jgi:hypothetical protein
MLARSYIIITRIKTLLMLALCAATVIGFAAPAARAQGFPPLPGPTCAPQPTGAAAWYPGNGTAEDVQGGNHGTLHGGAAFTKGGKVGAAFLLDGADDFVLVPASNGLDVGAGGGLTVELWIKPSDFSHYRPLVEWNNGGAYGTHFWMNVLWGGSHGPGALYGNLVDTNGVHHYVGTAAILEANVYQHVALTYDKNSGTARIFRNGVQIVEAALGTFTPQTTYDLYLGGRPGALPYQGSMDEVGIYGRALDASEIQSIVNAGNRGKCAYSVGGLITDECGAPLERVVVNAERLGGGVFRTATTDDEGRYTFNTIPAGASYTFTPQPIQTPGRFVPPSVTFVNLSRSETAAFYHRPLMPSTCKPPIVYLSDLNWLSAVNGWGPVELDESNGDWMAGDGQTITLNGVAYDKGLGVHANSEIVYDLGGGYSSFVSDVGVDDETGANGTVRFYVYADGALLFDSGAMTGASPTRSINVNVAGAQELRLVVDHTGDNLLWDHADWAGARLVR